MTPRDDNGNVALVDDPSRFALVVSPESRAKLVDEGAFVGPAADGTYTALWRGVAPGSVDVEIKLDGEHLPGSPKQISMLINPLYMNINPLLAVAEGPALLGATAGAPGAAAATRAYSLSGAATAGTTGASDGAPAPATPPHTRRTCTSPLME